MRIAIIGTMRSGSSILGDMVSKVETYNRPDHINLKEHYHRVYHFDKETISPTDLTKRIFNEYKSNFTLKILGFHLSDYGLDPKIFELEKYDKRICLERYDFFERCCSFQVAKNTGIFHLNRKRKHLFDENRDKQFTLTFKRIKKMSIDLENYLILKKYLIDNNLTFELMTYDQVEENPLRLSMPRISNDYDYSQMITNYHLRDTINSLANECFNFLTCLSKTNIFLKEVQVLFNKV